VPVFRGIFEAVVALPDGVPVGEAAGTLDDRSRDAWDRLASEVAIGDGFNADREYAGAYTALEEIHSFADIAAEQDPVERNRRWQATTGGGQARFRLYLARSRRPREGRTLPPPEE